MTDADAIANFYAANKSASFKFRQKTTGKTADGGKKDAEIMVSLKCLSHYWRTLETPLINCEINLMLSWSEKCVLSNYAKAATFAITDRKLYAPVVTLSTQDNAKLFGQLKPGFKRIINWNKYEPKVSVQGPNPYLDFLINPSFQGANRRFVLSFKNKDNRTVHTKYYPLTAEIKD